MDEIIAICNKNKEKYNPKRCKNCEENKKEKFCLTLITITKEKNIIGEPNASKKIYQ